MAERPLRQLSCLRRPKKVEPRVGCPGWRVPYPESIIRIDSGCPVVSQVINFNDYVVNVPIGGIQTYTVQLGLHGLVIKARVPRMMVPL